MDFNLTTLKPLAFDVVETGKSRLKRRKHIGKCILIG